MHSTFALLLRTVTPLLLTLAPLSAQAAPELPRRAALGVALPPPEQGQSAGAVIGNIHPGLTAEKLGLRAGDIILSVGGKPVPNRETVLTYAATLKAGDAVDVRVRREGKEISFRGKAIGRPFERYSGAAVNYGSLAFRNGQLRDILVTPAGSAQPPVVFLIPGYGCGSIEPQSSTHPYRRVGEELIARGIAYYRVEKPFAGDSRGDLDCNSIDFATELDSFRTAYKHLVGARGISPDRIFMLGHSLGGMEAPLLAAENAPRGVAVFGTVLRNWADYHRDVGSFQRFLFNGADPALLATRSERNRELFRRFYFGREAPAAMAAEGPETAQILREAFSWDGRDRTIGGRSYKFNQDLAYLPLMAAWRDAKTNVLALYGESDIVAINDEDHRLIADIAEFYRPGTGRFVEVAGTDHGMELVGNRAEVREKTRAAAGQVPTGPFNPAVADALAAWIKDVMARPPVRTLKFPPREPLPED